MKIKAIITGSTGMIGKGVLLECLTDSRVESVLVINRYPSGLNHEKLREVVHKDLFDLSPVMNEIGGYNTCFFCLGVSAAGMTEKEYHKITYDLTLHFAQTLVKLNPRMTFCYISGAGTDSSEKGRIMWARVKGKTENVLLDLPFEASYMFRPGFIQPMKGIKSRTGSYNLIYNVLKPFYPILKEFKGVVTNTEKLGRAMIHVGVNGYVKNILESSDINSIAENKNFTNA